MHRGEGEKKGEKGERGEKGGKGALLDPSLTAGGGEGEVEKAGRNGGTNGDERVNGQGKDRGRER